MNSTQSALPLFVLYLITLVSIIGGWLPTYFVNKKKMNPYAGRMKAMLIFAFFPLLAMLAQPLGETTYWIPVIIIGIAGAAHQAWSANIFSTIGDMFPKKAVASVVGIGGMAGGLGGVLVTKLGGGLFDHYKAAGHIETGYSIMFVICSFAYLAAWLIMKSLVPRYRPISSSELRPLNLIK